MQLFQAPLIHGLDGYYMAILLFVGLACGAITGIAARATISHMKKLNRKS